MPLSRRRKGRALAVHRDQRYHPLIQLRHTGRQSCDAKKQYGPSFHVE